jgi:hypothetical protein
MTVKATGLKESSDFGFEQCHGEGPGMRGQGPGGKIVRDRNWLQNRATDYFTQFKYMVFLKNCNFGLHGI